LTLSPARRGLACYFRTRPGNDKQDSLYYIFCTGFGISVWSSADMQHWKKEKPVFGCGPVLAVQASPGLKGTYGRRISAITTAFITCIMPYLLLAKNTSAIGLATNKTLYPASPDYKWEIMEK